MNVKQAEDYAYRCAQVLRDDIMEKTTYSVSIGVSYYCSSPALAWRGLYSFGFGKIVPVHPPG